MQRKGTWRLWLRLSLNGMDVITRLCSQSSTFGLPRKVRNTCLGVSHVNGEVGVVDIEIFTMSSYELLVQDPMSPAENSSFQPCSSINDPNLDSGVARSGVKGPLIVGSSSDRSWEKVNRISFFWPSITNTDNVDDLIIFSTFIRTQEVVQRRLIRGASNRPTCGSV